jgi:HK97 family phage major capsid protein
MSRKEEIEARKLELREEIESAENTEKVEELNEEVDALKEEEQQLEAQEENEETAQELEEKKVNAKEIVKEERKMTEEIRNSKEYIDAYAEYIKTGEERELRSLLTENVNGDVAIPEMVYDIVKTAWEKSDIMSLVTKVNVKGNLKVNFELTAGEATIHTEGSETSVPEEELTLGIVELKPQSIKKWIGISDEVYDMRGQAFLNYIYDELTQKIVKKATDELIRIIANLPATATASSVSANAVASAPALGTIAEAIANLNDEASDITIVMNKLTWGAFKQVQYDGNYAIDPFEGCRVVFNNSLPAYDTATAGKPYMIVGDFRLGALVNLPNGDGVDLKFDDTTLMTDDIIRILGRQYIGMGAVSDKAFALVTKPQA